MSSVAQTNAAPPRPSFLRAHRGALAASFLTQAVSSAANFALGLALVRLLSISDYGAYGLGLAACYLFAGIGNALLLTQMVVHAPALQPGARRPYAAVVLVGTAALSAAATAVVVLALAAARALGLVSADQLAFGAAVAVAAASNLLREFFVREAYVAHREARALAVTVVVALALATILAGARLADVRLTVITALLVFASAQAAGAITGLALSAPPLSTVTWSAFADGVRAWWHGGRWALGGVAVTWVQTQAYAYVTLAVLSTADVGRANAARLLVAPFLLLFPTVNQIVMPRLAELRERDAAGVVARAVRTTGWMLAAAAGYAILLVAAAPRIIPWLFGAAYEGLTPLVATWCAVLVALVLRDGACTLLQVQRRFRELALLNVWTAAAAVVAVTSLVYAVGAAGAMLGTAAGEVLLAVLLWLRVAREHRATEARAS